MPSVHHLHYVLCDRAADPAGEALPDIEIGLRLIFSWQPVPVDRAIRVDL